MRDFPVTAVHACAYRDGEHAGCVTFQSQLVHACVCYDEEQAWCVTFPSQLCMHVGDVMGSRHGA